MISLPLDTLSLLRPRAGLLLGGVALALLSACASDNPGIPPERDSLYFPTGISIDPCGADPLPAGCPARRDLLYVTNSNADLRYNGGTMTVLDLQPLPADLSLLARAVEDGGLDCKPDRIDAGRWECAEQQFILEDATIRIGDFPGEVRASVDPLLGDDGRSRVFTPIRGDTQLLWADVVQLDDKTCLARYGRAGCVDLRCDGDAAGGCGNVGSDRDCPIWDCAGAHRVTSSTRLQDTMPSEPFGIVMHDLVAVHVDADGRRRTCRDGVSGVSCSCPASERCDALAENPSGCCYDAPAEDHIYLTHLRGGEVSFLSSDAAGVELLDYESGFFNANGGIRGGYSLAPLRSGDAESPVFVSSRVDSSLSAFVVHDNLDIVRTNRLAVGAVTPGSDLRGIAFGPGGNVLYVVSRLPPSLVAIAIDQGQGLPTGAPLWATEVCDEPSLLRLTEDPRRPGDPTAGLAYVVCFSEAQVYVIDTVTGNVVGRVSTGEGPNGLEIDARNKRAFIANFAENTIGVIDLDPDHDSYLKMVLRIGLARRLVNN